MKNKIQIKTDDLVLWMVFLFGCLLIGLSIYAHRNGHPMDGPTVFFGGLFVMTTFPSILWEYFLSKYIVFIN